MIIDITRLRSGIDKEVLVDLNYNFSQEQLKKLDISSLDDLNVTGKITLDALKEIYLEFTITGTMVIPCAITLKPVEYTFEVFIDGNLDEVQVDFEKNIKKNQNTLDIFPIIWENILMEVPMRVVSEDADDYEVSGDGWSYTTSDCEKGNSELSKLKDLL